MHATVIATRQSIRSSQLARAAEPAQVTVHEVEPGVFRVPDGSTFTAVDGQPATRETIRPNSTFVAGDYVYRVVAFLTPWYE